MSAYTLLQLVEVLVASAVLLYGVLARSSTLTVLGGGFLMGKAILNILAPEGGSVYRRSLIGYFAGAIFVLIGVVAIHFTS
ncbi:MAG TPA: hypothetical protein VHW94_05810 [Candidatus Dormibacteraeota bacterium]|jgi:hypothetical protein|nr:hypothetical protein [Candidatus Dormibacteraeota bacterium]